DIVPYQSTHNTGGTIMGDDPETSVVNTYLQHWDRDNLCVLGAGNFPHAGGYTPTGTVGALAYRCPARIIDYAEDTRPDDWRPVSKWIQCKGGSQNWGMKTRWPDERAQARKVTASRKAGERIRSSRSRTSLWRCAAC